MTKGDQRRNFVSTLSIYKTPWEEKETRNVWLVINYIEWLILHSHHNDDMLNEWQLLR